MSVELTILSPSITCSTLPPPEMAKRFEAALTAAGVCYRAETYAGAAHGWMKPDFPVFNETAAERGWTELLELFGRALRASN